MLPFFRRKLDLLLVVGASIREDQKNVVIINGEDLKTNAIARFQTRICLFSYYLRGPVVIFMTCQTSIPQLRISRLLSDSVSINWARFLLMGLFIQRFLPHFCDLAFSFSIGCCCSLCPPEVEIIYSILISFFLSLMDEIRSISMIKKVSPSEISEFISHTLSKIMLGNNVRSIIETNDFQVDIILRQLFLIWLRWRLWCLRFHRSVFFKPVHWEWLSYD